ncbi:RagB/SusD family nutrient uptake outer membrane protein [uncultured Draconibacterium sp.]|uniref:RagB/SusD family nutrient uptake outer membrane protein n=1 Tax=uncultured Draconibacterium sp. TaxID=1573823 RepID=UPI002AA6E775|nr:RagB/SusD family nutrient uptake outer membrane protein [uncultured Draconibacterium sp.]
MKSKIILIGILGMFLMSCGDDFLTIPSETALTDDIFYETQADIEAAVNAVYAPLRALYTGSAATSNGANAAYIMGETHSDNARYIVNPLFRATENQEQVADFIQQASNSVSTFKYQQNYQVIAAANKAIATVDEAEIESENTRSNLKGQALCLRAFSYFDLVQYFGSVPLHLEPVTTFEGTALPLATTEELFSQIIADLTQAIDLLPSKSNQADLGRVTKGSAQMILANVYMVQKNYAAAETVLKEIVASGEYALMADYAAVFDPANKNNSESVFEIQYRQGTDGYSSTFFYGMVPRPMDQSTVATLTSVGDPLPIADATMCTPSPDLIAAYEDGDLRKDATIDYAPDLYGKVFPFCKKYLHPHQYLNNTDDNWPVYRYAEVLLFLAEAINEQGKPVSEALSYINTPVGNGSVSIRERAGLEPIIAGSQEELRDAIAQERRVELAFEAKRWLDLARTGKAVEVMSAYGARVKADPAAYYFPTGYNPPASAFSQIDLVWPLPAAEAMYSPYF